eukprot:scaffold381_cov138-Cylindrotheca_fusiformis.AAC.4
MMAEITASTAMSSFASPLSYSLSAASSQRPKLPPPPPSSRKHQREDRVPSVINGNDMPTPSVLLRSLHVATPRQQSDDVKDLLQYIDNMDFSPRVTEQPQNHSLYLEDQHFLGDDLYKSMGGFQRDTFCHVSPALKDLTNSTTTRTTKTPVNMVFKGSNFPEMSPVRTEKAIRSPTLAYLSMEQKAASSASLTTMSMPEKKSRDPIGLTPRKSKENHLHDESRYYAPTEEEPLGNSPPRGQELHLHQTSRYYMDDDSSASSLVPDKNSSFISSHANEVIRTELAPTPRHTTLVANGARAALEPSMEQSMEDAWSVVLGSTIIEEDDPEEKENPATPDSSRGIALDELPERIKSPEDAKKLLRTAVQTLQDARAERESARQWASEMKDAVHKWVEEQKQIMPVGSNISEAQSIQQAQIQSLSNLEESVQKLCQQVQTSDQNRQSTEDKLQQLLVEQQTKIQSMTTELMYLKQQMSHREAQKQSTPQQRNAASGSSNQRNKKKQTPNKDSPRDGSTSSSTASTRIRKRTKDGGHVIIYGNGVRKEVHKDGTTVIRFNNGDVETSFAGGTVAYFHANDRVMQISNTADGSTLFEYPNRQIERHYKDGSKAILFADGTRQRISASGKVQTAFAK